MSNFSLQASVFVQSHVRAHVELMWLLSSATPIGWLNRMIQFKEKSLKAVSFMLYAVTYVFAMFIVFSILIYAACSQYCMYLIFIMFSYNQPWKIISN